MLKYSPRPAHFARHTPPAGRRGDRRRQRRRPSFPPFFMLPPPFVQRASWIWSAEGTHAVPPAGLASPSHYQVRYFRRTFDLADPAEAKLLVHLSADSRYLFYCNGT